VWEPWQVRSWVRIGVRELAVHDLVGVDLGFFRGGGRGFPDALWRALECTWPRREVLLQVIGFFHDWCTFVVFRNC
jgi:hypothetical protein